VALAEAKRWSYTVRSAITHVNAVDIENVCSVYLATNRLNQARGVAETILNLNRAARDSRGVAASLDRVARTLSRLGRRYRESIPFLEREYSRELNRGLPHPFVYAITDSPFENCARPL